jgi:hypothetical protein
MLSDYCIYTIRDSAKFGELDKNGGGNDTEHKRWVAGKRLLEEAEGEGKRLPIVFARAQRAGALLGWALVDKIIVDNKDTEYSFSAFQRFEKHAHLKSSLKKRDGKPLDENFIRPYAICRTPAYLREG